MILGWLLAQKVCIIPKSTDRNRIEENWDVCLSLTQAEQDLISTITSRVQPAERNMVSLGHVGFDTFNEQEDLP